MIRGMLLLLLLSSFSPSVFAGASEVTFKANSAELDVKQKETLSQLAEETQANHNLAFTIEEHAAKGKPRSLVFNIERVRALKIFQHLVQNGVDPARIRFHAPWPASKGDRFKVTAKVDDSVGTTNILQPTPAGAAGAQEFRFFFPVGSAEFEGLNEAEFKDFLNSLGQPGNDVILIQGFTDTSGSVRYNEVLSELRALRVYEHLVRAGVSPIRIKTAGMGVAKSALDAKDDAKQQAFSRQTLVSWTTDDEVRAKTTPPPPPEPSSPVPVKDKSPEVLSLPGFELILFGGQLIPLGTLKEHAKSARIFGLGIGKTLWQEFPHAFRLRFAGTTKAKLPPAEADRTGNLEVQLITTRLDYVHGVRTYKPFIGLGMTQATWEGVITKPSTLEQKFGKNKNFGATINCGVDIRIAPQITVAPEFSYTSFGGDFSEPLATGLFAFIWEI